MMVMWLLFQEFGTSWREAKCRDEACLCRRCTACVNLGRGQANCFCHTRRATSNAPHINNIALAPRDPVGTTRQDSLYITDRSRSTCSCNAVCPQAYHGPAVAHHQHPAAPCRTKTAVFPVQATCWARPCLTNLSPSCHIRFMNRGDDA